MSMARRQGVSRRVIRLAMGAAAFALVAAGLGASQSQAAGPVKKGPIRVTFVGDSVPASITYDTTAQRELRNGMAVRLDLKVCRRLVEPSCSYQGVAPPSALQAVRSYGRRLGKVLVVMVGYNEGSRGYGRGIDLIMRAALAQGAKGVVWVTLREENPIYRSTNAVIRAAAKRWPQMLVADWNAYSAGRPASWFGSDGLHLTATGATALAAFLRPSVFRAAGVNI